VTDVVAEVVAVGDEDGEFVGVDESDEPPDGVCELDGVAEGVTLGDCVREVVGDGDVDAVPVGDCEAVSDAVAEPDTVLVDESDEPADGVGVGLGVGDADAATTPLIKKGVVYDCPGAPALAHDVPPLPDVATAVKGRTP